MTAQHRILVEDGVLVKYHGPGGDVAIPGDAGIKWIGEGAFFGSRLTGVSIPEGVEGIGQDAFAGCTRLKRVSIPRSAAQICWAAFFCCEGLESVTIPEGISKIGPSAFQGCSGLKRVDLRKGVAWIGPSAFQDCTGLEGITIPEGVDKLCEGTFEGCRNLKAITLPASVTRIGARAFDGCPGLAIRAPRGSHAERYAKRKKIPFRALDDATA